MEWHASLGTLNCSRAMFSCLPRTILCLWWCPFPLISSKAALKLTGSVVCFIAFNSSTFLRHSSLWTVSCWTWGSANSFTNSYQNDSLTQLPCCSNDLLLHKQPQHIAINTMTVTYFAHNSECWRLNPVKQFSRLAAEAQARVLPKLISFP